MLILYGLGEVSMSKFLSVLVAGLITGSLSVSAFAADSIKPQVDVSKAKTTVVVKKETGIKTTVKKLAPLTKSTDVKPK